MAKTIVVKVTRMVGHKKYGRIVRVTKKFYAHDETGQAALGDTVRHCRNAAHVKIEALAPGGSGRASQQRRIAAGQEVL